MSLVCDLLAYAQWRCVNGMLLSLYQRKTFDSMEHDYMYAALEAFRFSVPFVGLLRLLYTATSVAASHCLCDSLTFFSRLAECDKSAL